ncbi:MAG: AAA family ATPase [Thermoplasmata archaeon]|nr:AAA family ATPase [Thermoplasmata archaeon]
MALFTRKIYDEMLSWKNRYQGKCALLVKGARRVGKTTIVRRFAKEQYDSFIFVDFSKSASRERKAISEFDGDMDMFFLQLQRIHNTPLRERRSVIVFDEVQLFPLARQMIKHLVADGRYDYIETGSLLSIRQNVQDILIPSEEVSITMHPMDFEEFLWTEGDELTVPLARKSFESRKPLGREFHESTMRKYYEYMLVGGMPQAVDTFRNTGSYNSAEEIKLSILEVYLGDTAKIVGKNGISATSILRNVPAMLSKGGGSFKPGAVEKGSTTEDHLDAVVWLSESMMVNVCYRCTDPGPTPDLFVDPSSFKVYMVDTGLLFTAATRSDKGDVGEIIESLVAEKDSINAGMLFENAVSQELTATGHSLMYSRFRTEETTKSYEVDFLLFEDGKVIPLEVKSGESGRHKSLNVFMEKYRKRISGAYVVHRKDLRVDGDITYIPLYMAMFLRRG